MIERAVFTLVLVFTACGPTQGASDGGDDKQDPCTATTDCSGGSFCDPTSQQCVEQLSCATHDDCGGAAYCNVFDQCQNAMTGSPCFADTHCIPQEDCIDGSSATDGVCGCDAVFIDAEAVPPNFLIVLDRSGSMDQGTRWQDATTAVNTITSNFSNTANLGLMLFPSNNGCAVSNPQVPVGPNTTSAISSTMNASGNQPVWGGGAATPIDATLEHIYNGGFAMQPTGENIVIMVTDGGESGCGGSRPAAIATAGDLYNNQNIKVFTVAFAGLNATDLDFLNNIAVAGGSPQVYEATDQTALTNVLNGILGSVLPCSFALNQQPAGMDDIFVYADGTELASGWTYDSATNQVRLDNMTCQDLRNQGVTELDVVVGCNVNPE